MPSFAAQDPEFDANVRRSFEGLTLMRTVGARLHHVAPGEVEIDLPFRDDLAQHHGYVAGAVLTAIGDVACGYAAMTLMPSGASVLTVEYKVNFLSPAQGERMLARGRVIRPGRTVTVCGGDVLAVRAGEERLVATMLATMATVRGAGRNVPPSTPPTAHEHRLGVHRSPGSWRQARPWCVCRGGKLRQRLRHFSEVRSSSGE
jgi:uncharacterized protein (TIGR00369 family)